MTAPVFRPSQQRELQELHGRVKILEAVPSGTSPAASSLSPIFDTVLAVDTATVVTPTIPSTYKNLLVYASIRSTRVNAFDLAFLRLNGDSGANYLNENTSMTFTTVSANADLTATGAYWGVPGSLSNSLFYGASTVNLFDYTSAHAKLMLIDSYYLKTVAGNNEAVREVDSSGWNNAAVVTTLTFSVATGNLAAGSRFSVYALG